MRSFKYIFLLLFVGTLSSAYGQSQKYLDYISKYSDIAIEQMRKYHIPASITMAQGLLESGAGTSSLAVKGNNHFGIKCHSDWTGPYMLRDDDAPNERFRVYKNAKESYEDHSLFLVGRRRYASLFKLSITDYKGWAYGLKAAGYATSPTYATNLIHIIERYNLMELDEAGRRGKKHAFPNQNVDASQIVVAPTLVAQPHSVAMNNRTYYVIAKAGDTYKSLAEEFETSERRLRKYNEVDKRRVLQAGDIVYLHKKQKRAHKIYKRKYHQIQSGESLYDISQKYGMRVKSLYILNHLEPDYTPRVGDKIRLR